MQVHVQDNSESSEPILVTNGVKQGCVLAPTLFSIMFSAMLSVTFRVTAMASIYITVLIETAQPMKTQNQIQS